VHEEWSGESELGRQDEESRAALQVAEAADRAGAIVTEQIRGIIEQAQSGAAQIRESAERDAAAIRQRAAESASRLLERINAIDGPLSQLVAELQREAQSLTDGFDHTDT
jgi:molecular chaperone GrpE (heat shock protein)